MLAVGGALVAAIVVVIVLSNGGGALSGAATPSPALPSAASVLAPAGTAVGAGPVDGVQCGTTEEVLVHMHAHLAVYADGRPRTVPEGIGIVPPRDETQTANGPYVTRGTCFYWLHSHTVDGIIHIESPVQRTFTLGEYFDIWEQPLSGSRVGPAVGPVHAYVNGVRSMDDPRTIPLTAHALVQLDVGQDVAPQPFTFPAGL